MLPPVSIKPPGWAAEFRAFIMRGNVVDLAVGVIIGAAFTGIVNSLVKDIINPIIGLALGGVDFSNVFIALNGQRYDTLDAAQKANAATLNVGLFLNAVINFLIIALVIFLIVKLISKVMREKKPDDAPAAPTTSEVLLTEIRDLLAARPPGPAALPPAS
jgi:large conductance mechanosensitive channel